MHKKLSQELHRAAEIAYNPSWGWDTLGQPVRGVDVETYIELAQQAAPSLKEQLAQFCERQKLSYVFISAEAYNQSYEYGSLNFRNWFNKYCAEHGLNQHAQVAIIGPCVKPLESARRKNELDPAERIKDFLRANMIYLNEMPHKAAKERALDALGDAIMAVEAEPAMALGRKNTLFEPKGNGYRDYKSIWRTTIGDDQLFAGESVLAEVKFEPECAQDINRMTRRFMGITRATTHQALPEFFKRCGMGSNLSDRTTYNNYSRLDSRLDLLNDFSRMLYDKMFAEEGFNRFLDKKILQRHNAPSSGQAYILAKKLINEFGAPPQRDRDIIVHHLPKLRGLELNHA